MNQLKTSSVKEKDDVYSLQKLMYEYSQTIDCFSDPKLVQLSQQLDEKLNVIQRTKVST